MSYLKRIIYNCRKATLLIEKKEMDRLSLREAFELRVHLVGCSFCRIYKKQSRVINQMVRQLFNDSAHHPRKLDENFKKELQDRIEDELSRN
ncbi:MAG TPA: hypothetical protein VHA56_02465 [Mucilaginibacter sp.]|nr:hypothetical protein [Mucilaginibacter sp.]